MVPIIKNVGDLAVSTHVRIRTANHEIMGSFIGK